MADDDGTNADGQGASGPKTPEFAAITTQAEFEDRLKDRLRRERDKFSDYGDLKRKAEAHDQAEADKLSEVDKATQRATAAEQRAEQAEARVLRLDVAAAKGVPATLAGRLTGTTREELEADADALLELVKPPDTGGPHRPLPDPHRHQDPSKRPNPGDSGRAEAARRFGGKSTTTT